jgi:hypothetical protein
MILFSLPSWLPETPATPAAAEDKPVSEEGTMHDDFKDMDID